MLKVMVGFEPGLLCSVSVRDQAGARAWLGDGVREAQRRAVSDPGGAGSVGAASPRGLAL